MGSFGEECDRLSLIADPSGFERNEWAHTGGKVLENAVSLTQSIFKDRSDLQVIETEAEARKRCLILSTTADWGEKKIALINFAAKHGMLTIWATDFPDAQFHVTHTKTHYPEAGDASRDWIESALAQIISSIERTPESTGILADDDD